MRLPVLLRFVLVIVSLLVLGACAADGRGPRQRELARLERFERFAGPPVDSFRFWQMDRWESLGPDSVAIWTRPNEAWLLTVRQPCHGLEFAMAIGLSSTVNRVSRLHDEVRFEQQRCRIEQIRPIDVRAMREAAAHQE